MKINLKLVFQKMQLESNSRRPSERDPENKVGAKQTKCVTSMGGLCEAPKLNPVDDRPTRWLAKPYCKKR